jgi:DNA-binding NarL/FixJ family response regulator
LLAERHLGLSEGVHGLLESLFGTVVMVADAHSLQETARRLRPEVAVVDLSLTRDSTLGWLRELRGSCPELKVIVISVHEEPRVRRTVMAGGADGFVLKRSIATELMPTIDALLAGSARGTSGNGTTDRPSRSSNHA